MSGLTDWHCLLSCWPLWHRCTAKGELPLMFIICFARFLPEKRAILFLCVLLYVHFTNAQVWNGDCASCLKLAGKCSTNRMLWTSVAAEWRSSVASADEKSAGRSTPQICLQEYNMNEDHRLCLLKACAAIKHFERQNQTHTNWNGSCFSFSIMALAFYASARIFVSLLFHFFFLLHMHVWTRGISLIFSSLSSFSLRYPEDQTKTQKYL